MYEFLKVLKREQPILPPKLLDFVNSSKINVMYNEPINFKNGYEISIQASMGHYCLPRENLKLTDYTNFEIMCYKDGESVPASVVGFIGLDDIPLGYLKAEMVEKIFIVMRNLPSTPLYRKTKIARILDDMD